MTYRDDTAEEKLKTIFGASLGFGEDDRANKQNIGVYRNGKYTLIHVKQSDISIPEQALPHLISHALKADPILVLLEP